WITKQGYPMLRVSVTNRSIILEQERFSLLGNVENLIYKVPITMEVNGKSMTYLLDKEKAVINIDEDIRSIKVNLDKTGFYRVLYNTDLFLNARLSELDKWGIINDYWAFLLAGKISYNEYEKIINNFFNDREFMAVNEISNQLSTLYAINPSKYGEIAKKFHKVQLRNWRNDKTDLGKITYSNILYRLAFMDEYFSLGLSELFKFYDNLD
ncbi:leucyl aminopeptidase, partial [Sulfolobus sp. F3]